MADGRDMAHAEVEVKNASAYVVGRNGTFTPTGVSIWTGAGLAHIEANGQRGSRLNAGIGVPPEEMDKLAMRWLQARGIIMPSGVGIKAG